MFIKEMVQSMKKAGLVLSGAVAGVLLSLGLTAYADKKNGVDALPIEDVQKFSQVLSMIKNNYVDEVSDKDLIANAISGMVKELDPHSAYFDEKEFKDLRENISGKFSGVGLEVQPGKNGGVMVVAPIEDTPAFKAGVLAGDLIVSIDGQSVSEMKGLSEAISKLRGAEGSVVKIAIVRTGESKPIIKSITRAVIKTQSVKGNIIEPGYAWVRITQFQEPTLKDFVNKLKELNTQEPLKGLVLDLRNDPGGSLDTAIGVTAAFLPRDQVAVTSRGVNSETREYKTNPADYARGVSDFLTQVPEVYKTVPMVVLVNGGSASASEIVAGALQDYKRAIIMGGQTFGKGSVQQVIPLDKQGKTGVKLTIARYYTPNGTSLQARGVIPDVFVDDFADGRNGHYSRESDLPKHLSNDSGVAIDKKRDVWDEWAKEEDEPKKNPDEPVFKYGNVNDFPLKQAINKLKGQAVQTSSKQRPTVLP
ncbi:MAG: putative CtpA-like serine protease [Burkholderiaceae bacterium]|nr:putative CtpA-like serine protease [Burkholderiaceae bacterium]